MTTRVPVSPAVLALAVRRSGHNVEELAKRSGLTKLPEWLSNTSSPTVRQLELLADATATPFGYLLLDHPVDEPLPIPYFHTRTGSAPKQPSLELAETIRTIQRRQDWLSDYLREFGGDPLQFIGSASPSGDPRDIAADIHRQLGEGAEGTPPRMTWQQMLKSYRRRVESQGISVVMNGVVGNNTHRKLDPAEFSGFTLVDKFAPFIFLNGAEAAAAQTFTLAHELAHVWFGEGAACAFEELHATNHALEQACDEVAAEFLLPSTDLADAWSPTEHEILDIAQLRQLAKRFCVSDIILARRALDVGFITPTTFSTFYQSSTRRDHRTSAARRSGGDYYRNQNSRVGGAFARVVRDAVASGSLLYRDAYDLTGLHGHSFDKYMARLDQDIN